MPPTPPSSALPYLQEAAAGTGLPLSVVEAQNYAESAYGTNNGPSSAGALGPWQFLPSTYASVGGAPGGINSWGPETKAYITYMNQLLSQEGGNIFKALEAYNAGPGNLGAGAGYASSILSSAGVSSGATAGKPGSINNSLLTNSASPAGVGSGILNALTDPFGALFGDLATAFGVPSIKDLFQRAGLIILGGVLIVVGLFMIEKKAINSIINVSAPPSPAPEDSTQPNAPVKNAGKTAKNAAPLSDSTSKLAGEAVDAAIVA